MSEYESETYDELNEENKIDEEDDDIDDNELNDDDEDYLNDDELNDNELNNKLNDELNNELNDNELNDNDELDNDELDNELNDNELDNELNDNELNDNELNNELNDNELNNELNDNDLNNIKNNNKLNKELIKKNKISKIIKNKSINEDEYKLSDNDKVDEDNNFMDYNLNNKNKFNKIKNNKLNEQIDEPIDINYNNSVKLYENINHILSNKKNKIIEAEEKNAKKNKTKNTVDTIKEENIQNSAIKKGPGRPRKTPKKEPSQRKGITSIPLSIEHHIEFLYDQPVIFKKLSQFFKLMASKTLQILFRKNDIIIYTPDHHQKSKIRVKIDALKLNHYYLKENTDIGIMTKYLEMLFNKVDKDYSDLLILSNIGETQKTLNLVFNNEIQVHENHTIELIGVYDRMENESDFIDENYTIKLDLPGKYFKKIINDIKSMSNELSIYQNTADSPLVMGYVTPDRKIRSEHYIKNNNKIKLKSYLNENKSFRANLKIDYIKPISSSQLNDNIQWFIDENKGSMIKTVIDNGTIEIKIITEIIDERNEVLED
jgi:hypothetical protein